LTILNIFDLEKNGETMMLENHIQNEMYNIYVNQPLFPGDTMSHKTANECVRRGWAKRDRRGNFVSTGVWPRCQDDREKESE